MTNAELLAKIKAEIERLKTVQLKRIQEGDLVDAEPYDKEEAYNELLDFLSTLESEKPMNLEEEINRYLHEECSDDDEPGIHEIAEHFAQWGAEHLATSGKTLEIKPGDEVAINGHKIVYDKDKGYVTIVKSEEGVPNDLEEAADKYAEELTSEPYLQVVHKTDFIAGAKWQAEQLLKSSPLPEDTVLFNKGVEEGKRLMMEDYPKWHKVQRGSCFDKHTNFILSAREGHFYCSSMEVPRDGYILLVDELERLPKEDEK